MTRCGFLQQAQPAKKGSLEESFFGQPMMETFGNFSEPMPYRRRSRTPSTPPEPQREHCSCEISTPNVTNTLVALVPPTHPPPLQVNPYRSWGCVKSFYHWRRGNGRGARCASGGQQSLRNLHLAAQVHARLDPKRAPPAHENPRLSGFSTSLVECD